MHAMTLDEYLAAQKSEGVTETAFATLIGVDQSTVNRLRKGGMPTRPVMERIFRETDGKVTGNDFFGLEAA